MNMEYGTPLDHRKVARRRQLRLLMLASSMWAAVPMGSAPAQPAPASDAGLQAGSPTSPVAIPPNTGRKAAVEEVVVTARRRSERLEKVPAAVTAIGATQLAQRNIHTQQDLQRTVPGLTIRQTESDNILTYSIRGQTVDAFTGSATAVVPYVDEVQQNVGGAATLFDLSSIQVLKGPQGTLFGRNATGGAVLFTTAPPVDKLSGFYQERIGNYGLFEEQGALNIPIVPDKVLLRGAFDFTNRDGYVHNIYFDKDQGVVDRQSGRVSLALQPTDELKNTTVYEYDHSAGNSAGDTLYSFNQIGSSYQGRPLADTAALFFSPALDQVIGVPGAFAAYLAANPKVYQGSIGSFLNYLHKQNFWDIDSQIVPYHSGNDYYVANTTTYDPLSWLQIKNIFGYSGSNAVDSVSETGTPYGIQYTQNLSNGHFGDQVRQHNLSDELQAQGKLLNDTLTYIVGGYYQHDLVDTFYPQTYFNLPPIIVAQGFDSNFRNTDQTEAVYAQSTYDLGALTGVKGLSFTAGYRYSFEQVTTLQLPGSDYYPAPQQSHSFSNPSWTLGMSYQVDPSLLLYIQGRRSWRSGGLNGVAPPVNATASGGGDEFGSEYTRDVEAGFKFGGSVWGKPATLNVAVFNQWIDNVQRAEFPVVGGHSIAVTINVPSAEVAGIEVDTTIRPLEWLQLGASGALTDPRFTQGNVNIFGTAYLFDSYTDTPRASGDLFGVVDIPVPEQIGSMSVRGDIYAQTGQFFSSNNFSIIPGTALPGYGLVNLRYDWFNIERTKLSFAAFVNNLLDKHYYVGGLAQGASLGLNAAALGYPQMFGVEVKYQF